MVPKIFNCTQGELIAVAEKGWNSYLQRLTGFSSYRGYYDELYATNALAAVNAANILPDAQSRYANVEVYRVELTHIADTCLGNWQTLKRYTLTSFPADTTKARLEEAGSDRYEKARNYNWDEVKRLNTSGATFIATHTAALSAGNNMPATFEDTYNDAVEAFNAKYLQFIGEEEAAYNATELKVTACNGVYTTLINMFKDGQEIFKNVEGIRRQFTFDIVLGLISNPGQAGIIGIGTSSLDNAPIINLEATVLGTSFTTIGNQQGEYRLVPLSEGRYDVRFNAPGYRDMVINQFQVTTGTISTLDIQLDPE